MTAQFAELTERLIGFRDARDWRRFHGLKNLMVSLNLEAAELLELTQCRSDGQVEAEFRRRLGEECADVLIYLLLICERAGIDLDQATRDKITLNGTRYPVEKARGNALKYTEL